ncbi:hypothetical protein BDF14DRAFT_1786119 [Spinellus fusiger]|nr:hypothetical protein BDF14DRAFT_1786119 [Spinellus fusiger]
MKIIRFLFTMAKLTAAFKKPSRNASSRRTERREETHYSNRDSSASRDVQEHARSLEHLAQSCPVCLSAGTSISVSASPPCSSGEGSSPLGKRKQESEEISDRKGKKKAKIEEESEEESEEEREREREREEEERERVREETVAFEEMLLARFSVDIPVGEARQVPIDGPPPPTPPLSPLSRPLPHTPPPSPPHTPPPSPPRIVTARRPPLRRRETMI